MTPAANPDRVVFESSIVKVGAFRCSVGHPQFGADRPTKEYCFVFPRNAVWIEHEGRRPFVADSTTVPLYNPGRPYRRGAIDPGGDCTDWFSVSPELLREMVAKFDPGTAHESDLLFARGAVGASAEMFLSQRQVFNHITQQGAPDPLFVEESVIDMLSEVLSRAYQADRPAPGHNTAGVADRVRAHLGRTFLLKESVGELAAAVGVSPFHLCRVFRRETGYSLHRYRTELRLRWALQPLADGVDILTIALNAGFSHHSHFTTAFRRTFGLRPSEFRHRPQHVTSLSDRSK